MHHVHVDRVIDQPAEAIWAMLDDFGGVFRYHPLVKKSEIINGIGSGLGAGRECHFDDGNSIREEITAYEPGREFEVEIVDPGKFPLKRAIARFRVEPLGDARSRVDLDMAFRPKFGPLGWLMGKTVMAGQFRKVLGSVLEGLETHLQTGEIVSRKPRPTAAAQAKEYSHG